MDARAIGTVDARSRRPATSHGDRCRARRDSGVPGPGWSSSRIVRRASRPALPVQPPQFYADPRTAVASRADRPALHDSGAEVQPQTGGRPTCSRASSDRFSRSQIAGIRVGALPWRSSVLSGGLSGFWLANRNAAAEQVTVRGDVLGAVLQQPGWGELGQAIRVPGPHGDAR